MKSIQLKSVLLLLLSAATASAQGSAASNTWFPAGPQFSTVLVLERHPQQPGTLFAGAYFGGLYKSEDYGFTWQHVATDFSTRSIFAIAFARSQPSTIYVGTFRSGVHRSTDGGATWVAVNNGLTDLDVQSVAVDPLNADVVLAATSNGGLFRSADAGRSWTRVDDASLDLRGKSLVFDPARSGVVYLGTIGRGAYRSTDDGATWTAFGTGMNAVSVLSLRFGAPPQPALYAATDNGAFVLSDGATAWTEITGDLPPYPISDLLPHPVLKNMVFAATLIGTFVAADHTASPTWTPWTAIPTRVLAADPTGTVIHEGSLHGGLRATTDFGRSWLQANWGIQNIFVGALGIVDGGAAGPIVYAGSDFAVHRNAGGVWDTYFDQKQGVFDVQADPANPDTLYIGTEKSGVWKSTDGGRGWVPSSTNIVPAQIYTLGQSADGRTIYAGTSSGLYLSPDNGHLWVPGNTAQLGLVLSVAPDPTRHPFVFFGGPDGLVLRSDDGGWSYSYAGNGLPRESIVGLVTAPWEKTYAITDTGALFATSDFGQNWFSAKSGVAEGALSIAPDPQRPWILYLGTSGGGVYKSESGSLDWSARNSGLTSPWVFSIAVDPLTPSTVYAGTLDGVFKSTNAAASWTPLSTGLAPGAVTSVLVDRVNPSVVYASVLDGGIFRSANGGTSWTSIGGALPANGAIPLLINRLNASQLLAGTSLKGVFVSNDAGITWSPSSYGMTLFVRGLAIDPSRTATLYAGSLGAGVFKSTDAGQSWTPAGLRDRNIFKLAVDPVTPSTVYAATSQGVSRSTDGAATWRALGQKAAYVHAMVVDPRDRRRVFVGTTAGAVYRSADAGDTWELAAGGLPPYTVLALAMDPSSGALYAAPERRGIWRSANGGATWTRLAATLIDTELVSSLTVSGSGEVYAATLGAGAFVFRGGTWHSVSSGLASPQVSDIKAGANGLVLAATFDAGVFRSTDAGGSWSWASSGLTTSRVNSLTGDPASTTTFYAATTDGVFRSRDSGQNWEALNAGMRGVNTWAATVDPVTAGRLFAATNGRGIYGSADGGLTWTSASAGLVNRDVRAVAAGAAAGAFYAATLGGGVVRSSDGGTTWRSGVTLDLVDSFALALAVNPQNPSIVYAGTAGRGVLRSTNGGIDWEPVNNGLGSLFLLSLAIDKRNPSILYAGTAEQGVFYTTDSGNSWHALNSGLFNHVVTSLAIDPADSTHLYAGTEGGGVFTNHVSLPLSTCAFAVSAPSIAVGADAGTVTLNVTTDAACSWRADSGADWLGITGGASRSGSGAVSISVAINIGQDARSGYLTVAGQPVVVVQDGLAKLFRLTVARTGTGAGHVSTDWIGIDCGSDCEQLYTDRLPVVLTATAAQGSRFAGWEGHADCADGTVVMEADRACVARFEQTGDFDGDGLPNLWEAQFGLDAASGTGANGPDGDPDGDGATNLQEFQAGTHPRGTDVSYVADGQTGATVATTIALFNPGTTDARVLVRFRQGTQEWGVYRLMAAKARATLAASDVPELLAGSFAAILESDTAIVSERIVSTSAPHATRSDATLPSSARWYVPGSAAATAVAQRYAMFNPGARSASVDVTYLPPPPAAPVVRTYALAAGARLDVTPASDVPALSGLHVAAVAVSSDPIVLQSITATTDGRATASFGGAPGAGYLWYFAHGQTGPLVTAAIDLFNPTANRADLSITYVLAGGGIVQRLHQVPPFSGTRVDPAGDDALLRQAAFGAVISSTAVPFVAAAESWWPGSQSSDFYEGGATLGALASGLRWALAEGESGGALNRETEIAIANFSATAASARVTLFFDDGATAVRTVAVPAAGQLVIDVGRDFPEASWKRFSALVESLAGATTPAAQLVVEQVVYSSPDGIARSGGTRSIGVRLPE